MASIYPGNRPIALAPKTPAPSRPITNVPATGPVAQTPKPAPAAKPGGIAKPNLPSGSKPGKPGGTIVSKPPVKKPGKKPPMSALDKWLAGDDVYQQQLAEFNKEKANYQAQYQGQVDKQNRDYATTNRQMQTQATQDRADQQYDFAGRGILNSGVYAKSLGEYNTDFQQKINNLLQGKTDALGNLADERTNFLQQLQLNLQNAKNDAIRRRAQQLGL